MDDWKEFSAKTVEEALTEALLHFNTTSEKLEYEVIENGNGGVLALFEQGNLGDEIFFAVRCGDGDGVVFYIEEETVKNGH